MSLETALRTYVLADAAVAAAVGVRSYVPAALTAGTGAAGACVPAH
jgi:hypothetical protein